MDYLTQTAMTTIKSNVLQGVVDRYRDKPKNLDTLDDIVGEVNALPKLDKIERQVPYLRDVNEIGGEGLLKGFEHDAALLLVSIFKELGMEASYGFYFKYPENQQPVPKSAAIVDLQERGRWVVFDAENRQYNQFSEKIGDYILRGEGPDPISMGISDINTLLRWQEDKRIEILQEMGGQYMGAYGRTYTDRLTVKNNILELPELILDTFELRNPGSHSLYLCIGRYPSSSNGVMKYVIALDDKAKNNGVLDEIGKDNSEANIVEIKDGKIEIPPTFYDVLRKGPKREGAALPKKLEAVVIEAEREGNFFKIWGLNQYFRYLAETYRNSELMKKYSFANSRFTSLASMDSGTRIDLTKSVLRLLLLRKGTISEAERQRFDVKELIQSYENFAFPLFIRYGGQDSDGLYFTLLDTPPYSGEKGPWHPELIDPQGRVLIGKPQIFGKLNSLDKERLKGRQLSVDVVDGDDRGFKIKIKKYSSRADEDSS